MRQRTADRRNPGVTGDSTRVPAARSGLEAPRVRRPRLLKTPVAPAPPAATEPRAYGLKKASMSDLLRRLGRDAPRQLTDGGEGTNALISTDPPGALSVEDRSNAALGCKTSEVAFAILAQVVMFEHLNAETSDDRIDTLMTTATAMLAELEPTNATEALLAAQMIGTQRLAMTFLRSATLEGQTAQGAESHVLRATRLMRLFNEQVETMAKLKGKGGQQRVIVEHVTVAAGGQAIVGTVIPGGGRGQGGDDPQ